MFWVKFTQKMHKTDVTIFQNKVREARSIWSHMVRNHQNGYPYLNLSLFFVVVENILKPQFFCKTDWSMNSGRRRRGDSLGY